MSNTSIRLFKKNSAALSITQVNTGIEKINNELSRLNELNDTLQANDINTSAGISNQRNIMARQLSFLKKQKERLEKYSL